MVLETHPADLRNTTDTYIITQYRDIGSISDDLVALTSRVLKIKHGLAQVEATLASQYETLTNLSRIPTFITARLDGLSRAHVKVHDRLNLLKAAPPTFVPQPPPNAHPEPPVPALPKTLMETLVAIHGHPGYNLPTPLVPHKVASLLYVTPHPPVVRMMARFQVFRLWIRI